LLLLVCPPVGQPTLALLDHHLLDLGGTYGDPQAGDPVQVRRATDRARPGWWTWRLLLLCRERHGRALVVIGVMINDPRIWFLCGALKRQ